MVTLPRFRVVYVVNRVLIGNPPPPPPARRP
jgi:hypothetical protein